ncbi:EAL domain-containing protein [Evansella sp. LMS18]|uniref:EAL domain-containing protein n=1 Tax=Evansella sp. LMS18 TaxID=2924033 RepID=UPI0020D0E355|nr:EAL domain-containing protein [Evansella sp. LMS18]UTR12804.1 EAL domain-containing protein [Evansella sp. LMS18]
MECRGCSVHELSYEIKLDGLGNKAVQQEVINHLDRRGMDVQAKGNILTVNEPGVLELLDFCHHHLNVEEASFRLADKNWLPLSEVESVLELQWIDEVISKELITCFYQPIVTRDEEVYGYELLARFKREDGSFIFPGEIFGAAKTRGRLYALDRLCRMTAVRYAERLGNKKAFINFIPTSIYAPEYCLRSTIGLATQLGIDPAQLVFEVVETEKVDDTAHLKRILHYYKERGFKYALDDVGEGYNTFEMLEKLRPDYMKLDMKFVQGVAVDLEKQEAAARLLAKAAETGSVPLAEGVETKEDFEWLKDKGYELFQGYYFGKPAPSPRENKDSTLTNN